MLCFISEWQLDHCWSVLLVAVGSN